VYDEPRFLLAGDRALVVELGDSVEPEANRRVHGLLREVERCGLPGVVDLVPTYRSLLVQYNPAETSLRALQDALVGIEREVGEGTVDTPRVVRLPTLYGGAYGPDLDLVAKNAGLSAEDAVRAHSGVGYMVYMMGFTPGFPYLGGLAPELATPRLDTPRAEIPAGSVGIAGDQTGVYPLASPGGWRLIGRTPLRLFDPAREPPSLLSADDCVRFVPLESEAEYRRILGLVESGEFELDARPDP